MKYLLFLILPSLVLSWNTPINLSQMYGDDINPQVCRGDNYYGTCLVWQKVTTEAWNILARFYNGEWSSIIPVTMDSGGHENTNPAVAYEQWTDKVWVTWQKSYGNDWEIFAAQSDTNGFDSSYRLTNSSDFLDENPSVFVIRDTVWVTWESNGDSATRILAKCYDGSNWSDDFTIDQGNDPFVSNPKINVRHNQPIIVFRKWSRHFSHIYYTEYLNNQWTTPAVVCDDSGYNYNPEVIGDEMTFGGAIILWDNSSSKDIFRTAYDTFNIHYRITNDTIADVYPTAVNFNPPTFSEFIWFAWRRGKYIYSHYLNSPEFIPVDTTDSCSNPCLTAIGGWVWCIYQKEVGGDWEIFGTYESYGIEEKSSNRVKIKRLIPFNQLASFLREKPYEVYDITGRAIKNYTNLKSGLYFLKFEGEKISAVIVK